MPILQAPEHVLPALPTYAPVEVQLHCDDWVYVVTRYPVTGIEQRFLWRIGELYWTEIALH